MGCQSRDMLAPRAATAEAAEKVVGLANKLARLYRNGERLASVQGIYSAAPTGDSSDSSDNVTRELAIVAMALEYPNNLKYFDSHEYVRLDGEIATIGISAYAIDQLGDIVFLELPEVGTQASKGDSFGNIESVKAVEEIYAPLSGEVVECNGAMVDAPEQLVEDPYENGWLVKIRINDPNELEGAMSAEAYRALVAGD